MLLPFMSPMSSAPVSQTCHLLGHQSRGFIWVICHFLEILKVVDLNVQFIFQWFFKSFTLFREY